MALATSVRRAQSSRPCTGSPWACRYRPLVSFDPACCAGCPLGEREQALLQQVALPCFLGLSIQTLIFWPPPIVGLLPVGHFYHLSTDSHLGATSWAQRGCALIRSICSADIRSKCQVSHLLAPVCSECQMYRSCSVLA